MTSKVVHITDQHQIDLDKSKKVGISSREDLLDLLRSGEVLVYDTRSQKFVTDLFGVTLPSAERVVQNVSSPGQAGVSKIM